VSTPDSKTHRLCFFKEAPTNQKHVLVEHFVADEVEEYREFVRFLYPPKGQDRFKLLRPDINDLRWTVVTRDPANGYSSRSYAAGDTPLQAVKNARLRLQAEDEAERTTVPYSLQSTD
jgi:hypothetical protein